MIFVYKTAIWLDICESSIEGFKTMIDSPFRKWLPQITGPLLVFYRVMKLSPNHVTTIGFLFAIVSALFISQRMFVVGLICWWIGRLFDGTDGIYARQIHQTSPLGAHLDILLDMAAYSVVILAFFWAFPEFGFLWSSVLFLYVLCITGALSLGALMEKQGVSDGDNRGLKLAAGLAEGGETGIAYSIMLLFPESIEVLLLVWISILVITVVARFVLAIKVLK